LRTGGLVAKHFKRAAGRTECYKNSKKKSTKTRKSCPNHHMSPPKTQTSRGGGGKNEKLPQTRGGEGRIERHAGKKVT